MHRWFRPAAVLAALALAPAAAAADPAAVYSDYAQDGVLSCNHSRADLQALLSDATFNQYGDPSTLIGLKIEVRKQLAGSCERAARGSALPRGSSEPQAGTSNDSPPASTNRPTKNKRARPQPRTTAAPAAKPELAADDSADGRMLLLGGGLLLLTLGTGGWAARRAFNGKQ